MIGLTRLRMKAATASKAFYSSVSKHVFPPYEKVMLPEHFETMVHSKGSVSMWTKINIFLVVPITAAIAYFTIPVEAEHIKHLQEHPNEWVAFPYMRKRKNEYPWGDDSLFHNPNSNAKPEA